MILSDKGVIQQVLDSENNVKKEIMQNRTEIKQSHDNLLESIQAFLFKFDEMMVMMGELKTKYRPPMVRTYSDEQEKQVLDLRLRGYSLNGISAQTGLSKGVVRGILNKHPEINKGVSKPPDNTVKKDDKDNNKDNEIKREIVIIKR